MIADDPIDDRPIADIEKGVIARCLSLSRVHSSPVSK